jgi:Ca-activated chloride channel family protein
VSFGSTSLLAGLAAVPVAVWIYVLLERGRARDAAKWASPALMANMLAGRPGGRRHLPAALFLVALTFLLVAFARPETNLTTVREGATVVLTMDVSGSMAAADVLPTRARAVRVAAMAFLHQRPDRYRVALVVFAEGSAVLVPPTYDRAKVADRLPTTARIQGTALGDGLTHAVKVAVRAGGGRRPSAQQPPTAVLLFSDGEHNSGRLDPRMAAERARRAGVPISVVSVGTPSGFVDQRLDGGLVHRMAVPSEPDRLREVARISGGRFFSVPVGGRLGKVYDDLGARAVHERKRREVTAEVVGVALVFMLAGSAASAFWFRRPV